MKATPVFLGACALASVAGAVGGATMNTTPIRNAAIGMDMLPEQHIAFDASDRGLPRVAPPDHYALDTPQGRVEVAELSNRGLYSQRRFGWQTAQYDPPSEAPFVEEKGEWDRPETASTPTIEAPPLPAPVQSLALDRPADAASGHPKVIDVAVALASAR